MMKDNIKKIVKDVLTEATSSSKNSTYVSPLLPGYREFEKHLNGPFTEYVTGWDDPLLDHDSLDGKMSYSKKTIKKREKRAEKISRFIKNNPDSFAWDGDAGLLNGLPGQNTDAKPIKNFDPKKTTVSLDGKTKKSTVKEWVELDKIDLNEDLAVWFGKKKKPKGSKQPKGPWVNICRKVDGKHPPCGRSDTSKGAYPKCRAAGVAGKMSDSEKRSACQQKRNAEKKDTQTGKGQKPVMTSYKKKKTNEDMKKVLRLTESELIRIIKTVIKEQTGPLTIQPNQSISLTCQTIGRDTMSFDGTIETSSRNADWGTFDSETNTYVESDEVVPSFFVTKVDEYGGVLEGQKITKTFYIEPVTENMRARLGVNIGSSVITYFETSSPKKLRDMETKRFYCFVNSVGSQFRTELQNNGVTVR